MKYIFLALSLVAMTLSSACSMDDELEPPTPKPPSQKEVKLNFKPNEVSVIWGQKTLIGPKLSGQYTGKGAGAVIYSSSSKDVATVDSKGEVTLRKVGKVIISAKQEMTKYNTESEASYKLTITKAISGLSFKPDKLVVAYSSKNFKQPVLSGHDKSSGTVKYESSDKNVATVNDQGKLTLKGIGTTKITVTQEASDKYKERTTFYTLNVTKDDAEILGFNGLVKTYSSGGAFGESEIMAKVTGTGKTGYQLKQIKNISNDVATVSGKTIAFNKVGSFTVELVLGHATKKDATITGAVFEIERPKIDLSDGNSKYIGTDSGRVYDIVALKENKGFVAVGRVGVKGFVICFGSDNKERWRTDTRSQNYCVIQGSDGIVVGSSKGIYFLNEQDGKVIGKIGNGSYYSIVEDKSKPREYMTATYVNYWIGLNYVFAQKFTKKGFKGEGLRYDDSRFQRIKKRDAHNNSGFVRGVLQESKDNFYILGYGRSGPNCFLLNVNFSTGSFKLALAFGGHSYEGYSKALKFTKVKSQYVMFVKSPYTIKPYKYSELYYWTPGNTYRHREPLIDSDYHDSVMTVLFDGDKVLYDGNIRAKRRIKSIAYSIVKIKGGYVAGGRGASSSRPTLQFLEKSNM